MISIELLVAARLSKGLELPDHSLPLLDKRPVHIFGQDKSVLIVFGGRFVTD